MAKSDGKIVIKLELDGQTYDVDIDKATGRTEELGAVGKKTAANISHLAGTIGVASVAAAAFSAVKIAAEFEKLNAQLVTIEGSADAAEIAFQQIQQFATTTPYQLEEVTSAYIKLKNLGLDPSEAALRSYGNTASSMGKDLDQLIEAVADASVGEFERLKEFGIKASVEGTKVKFLFRGTTTEVRNSSDEIQKYLTDLGQTEFAGGMQRQMDTLGGVMSNLQDATTRLANKIASESGLTGALKEAAKDVTALLNSLSGAPQSIAELEAQLDRLESRRGRQTRRGFRGAGDGDIADVEEQLRQARLISQDRDQLLQGIADTEAEIAERRASVKALLDQGVTEEFTVTGSGRSRQRVLTELGRNNQELQQLADERAKAAERLQKLDEKIAAGGNESGDEGTGGAATKYAARESFEQAFRDRQIALIEDYYDRQEATVRAREERLNAEIRAKVENTAQANSLIVQNAEITRQELERIDQERLLAKEENQAREQVAAQQHKEELERIEDAKNASLLQKAQQQLNAIIRAQQEIQQQELAVTQQSLGLARQAAGENTALQVALFAAQKVIAIKQAIVSTELAAANALAQGGAAGPALAASIRKLGYVSVGIIAATSVIEGLKFAGGRAQGGYITPGSYAQIAERDRPELFRVGGKTYLAGGDGGASVTPAVSGQAVGMQANVTVNVINAPEGTRVEQRTQNGEQQIDVIVGDITARGRIARALETTYPGMQRGSR